MALRILTSIQTCNHLPTLSSPQTKSLVSRKNKSCALLSILCKASTVDDVSTNQSSVRRSPNFQPSIWDSDYILSLRSEYGEEAYIEERDGLKQEVRTMISKLGNPIYQLELIDMLQKLGISAHFKPQITQILKSTYNNNSHNLNIKSDLYSTALHFRLLRQHGYYVSQDVFNKFQDDKGNFKMDLSVDIKGMLSLYQASFLSLEGEKVLEEAREFSSRHLKEFVKQNNKDISNEILSVLVSHALEIPLHWRVPRVEARWFINLFENQNMISIITPSLLKLAKLDFNMVQLKHQQDLKYALKWCKKIRLGEKLSFARDRPVENFFWTVGMAPQPQLAHFRRTMTKVNVLITTIDDIYDAYGTLQELQLFTDVVDRWDVNAIDVLPEYMKTCFLALNDLVNEVTFDILKQSGYDVNPCLKRVWADLCKSYMVEAKWYSKDYIPSLQEYMENAWISISTPLSLVHTYFLIPNSMRKQDLDCLQQYPNLIRYTATIFRLVNDLGTSEREKETGDIPKSIKCYMNETGASEGKAGEHIKSMICNTWKKMNEEVANSSFSPTYKEIALNHVRAALYMYQHGDGHTVQDPQTKNRILSLLFHPVPMISTRN